MAFLRRLRGPRVDSVLALQDRHQRLPDRAGAAPDPLAALGPDGSVRRPRSPAEPRRAGRGLVAGTVAGRDGSPRPARRPGRGGGRARVAAAGAHREPAAPARPPARDPHPARGAGVLGGRDRGDPRHHRRRRSRAVCSAPAPGWTNWSRSPRNCSNRPTRGRVRCSTATSRPSSAPTPACWNRCCARTPRWRRRRSANGRRAGRCASTCSTRTCWAHRATGG